MDSGVKHGREMYLIALDYAIDVIETFDDIEEALKYLKKRREQKAEQFNDN